MPLAFVNADGSRAAVLLNQEERNLIGFFSQLEAANDPSSDYSVSVNIDLKFSRSKAADALNIQLSNDPNAPKVQLSEEAIQGRYPYTHTTLINKCKERYHNFLVNKEFLHRLAPLKVDLKYSLEKKLNPKNPKTQKQRFYSESIFSVFDTYYSLKQTSTTASRSSG